MIAPAGCGKTHLIAAAVASHGAGRELILTHTHAGVDALRRRLRKLGAAPGSFVIDTIAGWCLQLAAAFPATSGLAATTPSTTEEWNAVYRAAGVLIQLRPYQRIIEASYTGVYVDEYQDCTVEQHAVVRWLAEHLPCRVLGDPLQSIFGFRGSSVVDWQRDVLPSFPAQDGPSTPWRWNQGNPELGRWLMDARRLLENKQPIVLRNLPHGVRWEKLDDPRFAHAVRSKACNCGARAGETVVAIASWSAQGHKMARGLGGAFSCVEPIDAKDLFTFAEQVDDRRGPERALATLDFAAACMTGVSTELKTVRNAVEAGRRTSSKKHEAQKDALYRIVADDDLRRVGEALDLFTEVPGAHLFRRELFKEARRALTTVELGEAASVREGAHLVRSRTRQVGRPTAKRAFGTTLLVKGLEYDHAVVLDADDMTTNNLYVAMTRGSRTLTIVSKQPQLEPK